MAPLQETQPLNPNAPIQVKQAALEVRMGFVRKVYSLLCAQLLLTVLIAAPMQRVSTVWLTGHAWLLYLSMFGVIASMCVMTCCRTIMRQYPQNYIFMFVFTTFMGLMVGFVSATYTAQSVCLAAGITFLIFVSLTAFAWFAKTDFTGFGPYLFAASMGLCMFGMVIMVMSCFGVKIVWMTMLYDVIGVLLFSFYIIYDTQLILGEFGGHKNQFSIDDYAMAAMELYLDIINLFLLILKLLGKEKK